MDQPTSSTCSSASSSSNGYEQHNDIIEINYCAESQGRHTNLLACKSKTETETVDTGMQASSGNLRQDEEEEIRFDIQGRLNPMVIPSIINHVASFLCCDDLKRCRFLNKQWNEECSKYLRHRGLVKLTTKTAVDNYCAHFQSKPKFFQNFSFDKLTKDIESNKFFSLFGLHIKCFKLNLSRECQQLLTKARLFNLIFKKLPNLQELSLVACISDNDHFIPVPKEGTSTNSADNYRHSIVTQNINNGNNNSIVEETYPGPSTNTNTLPLLKYLEIFLYNTSGKDVSKHHFLIELLTCVPNMEKISVPKVPRMLTFGMPLFHTLVTASDLHFPKLSHLEMDIALYNGLIAVLHTKGYPLKYLNAEINSSVSEESLHSLLESFGKTLETLQLKFPRSPVASSEFRSAASFQRLKHLTLHGYKGPLKFLEQLNNLQSFEIIDNSFAVAISRNGFSKPLKVQFNYKMIWTHWNEEEYAFDCVNSSDAQLMRQFSKNFLNLTSLNLPHLNDNDLRVIYQSFPHSLQELTMENSLCSDYGLNGMDPALVREYLMAGKLHSLGECRVQPFIGNLTRLRRLEILTPSIELTDASIAYGITHCENLKILILRNAEGVTDIGLRRAVDMLQLEKLETTMCANIKGQGVKYALEIMTERGMTFIWNKHQGRLTKCCINRILNGNSSVTCVVP